jgi:Zn-dependent peptidase ImmA (M78 family)
VLGSIQQITIAQCCEVAEEVRRKYWPSGATPVDVDHIIDVGLKLTVIPLDDLRNSLDIYGFLTNDRTTIYVDSDMIVASKFEATLRFTMAHELGHFFLHKEFYESQDISSAKEWKTLLGKIDGFGLQSHEDQADEFAGRLLIPVDALRQELALMEGFLEKIRTLGKPLYQRDDLQQILQNFAADKLAPKFNVPFEVTCQRLKREAISEFAKL